MANFDIQLKTPGTVGAGNFAIPLGAGGAVTHVSGGTLIATATLLCNGERSRTVTTFPGSVSVNTYFWVAGEQGNVAIPDHPYVSVWYDKTAFYRDATQGVTTARPEFVANAITNYNTNVSFGAVVADGFNDNLTFNVSANEAANGFSFVGIVRRFANTNVESYAGSLDYVSFGEPFVARKANPYIETLNFRAIKDGVWALNDFSNTPTTTGSFIKRSNTTTSWGLTYNTSAGNLYFEVGPNSVSTVDTVTDWMIVAGRYTGSQMTLRVARSNVGTTNAPYMSLGNANAVMFENIAASIAEFTFYDRALTFAEIAAVENYLNTKYLGPVLNLVSSDAVLTATAALSATPWSTDRAASSLTGSAASLSATAWSSDSANAATLTSGATLVLGVFTSTDNASQAATGSATLSATPWSTDRDASSLTSTGALSATPWSTDRDAASITATGALAATPWSTDRPYIIFHPDAIHGYTGPSTGVGFNSYTQTHLSSSNSTYLSLSFWSLQGLDPQGYGYFLSQQGAIAIQTPGLLGGNNFNFYLQDQTGNHWTQLRSNTGYSNANGWVHVAFSANTNAAAGARTYQLYINDLSIPLDVIGDEGNAFQIYWNDGAGFEIATDGVSDRANSTQLSEVWLSNTFVDFSNTAIRRRFITSDRKANDLGVAGEFPTGTSPLLYLTTSPEAWENSGTGSKYNIDANVNNQLNNRIGRSNTTPQTIKVAQGTGPARLFVEPTVEAGGGAVNGAASLTGTATLLATAWSTDRAAGSQSGSGSLSCTPWSTDTDACTLTGTGALSATPWSTDRDAASLNGTASLAATPWSTDRAAASLTGTASLSATAWSTDSANAASLNGTASLLATAWSTDSANAASLNSGGTLVLGIFTSVDNAACAATGTAAIALGIFTSSDLAAGVTTLTGTATLAATPWSTDSANASSLSCSCSLSGTPWSTDRDACSLTGTASVVLGIFTATDRSAGVTTLNGTATFFCEAAPIYPPRWYTALLAANNPAQFSIYKTTNLSVDWLQTSSPVFLTNDIASMGVHQANGNIHVVTQEQTTGRVSYHKYNIFSIAWTLTDEAVQTPNTAPTYYSVGISVRTDQDVFVTYAERASSRERITYKVRETGTWSSGIFADGDAGAANYTGITVLPPDSSDRINYLTRDDSNAKIIQRSISSTNSLANPVDVDTSVHTAKYPFGKGIVLGGTAVYVPYLDANGNASIASWTSSATPTIAKNVDITLGNVWVEVNTPAMGMAKYESGEDFYLLWSRQSDQDIQFRANSGAGWGDIFEVTSAVTANALSVFTDLTANSTLVYIISDNGTIRSYETPLPTGAIEESDAVLTATATLLASAWSTDRAAGSQSGSCSISCTPWSTDTDACTLTGTGSLSATPWSTDRDAASLTGTGILTLGVFTSVDWASASLTGTATLAGTPWETDRDATNLDCSATILVSAWSTDRAAATLTGTATLSATPWSTDRAASSLSGTATILATAWSTDRAASSLSCTASCSATPWSSDTEGCSLTGTASLAATAWSTDRAASTLTGTATLLCAIPSAGQVHGDCNLSGTCTILASAFSTDRAAASISASGTLAATPWSIDGASVAISCNSTCSGSGQNTLGANCGITGSASALSNANKAASAAAGVTGTAALTVTAIVSGQVNPSPSLLHPLLAVINQNFAKAEIVQNLAFAKLEDGRTIAITKDNRAFAIVINDNEDDEQVVANIN